MLPSSPTSSNPAPALLQAGWSSLNISNTSLKCHTRSALCYSSGSNTTSPGEPPWDLTWSWPYDMLLLATSLLPALYDSFTICLACWTVALWGWGQCLLTLHSSVPTWHIPVRSPCSVILDWNGADWQEQGPAEQEQTLGQSRWLNPRTAGHCGDGGARPAVYRRLRCYCYHGANS